jgi:phosphatidylglycerol:prolipoprotein diacylglycerol transferase
MCSFAVIKIDLDPVLIHLGGLAIHWYGLMYVLGILAGVYFCMPYAQQRGISIETAYAIFWPVVVGSLAGGRLYYVAQSNLGWYLQHPQNILATWEGGMAFYGAVFLGSAVALLMSLVKRVSFAIVLDVAAVFIPVAQAIGRVGNIINGDIVGYRSSQPWATEYTNPHNTFVAAHFVPYDPAAAYELLFSLALFGLIWYLRFRLRVPGTLFALWLALYSVGQFLLFFDRANPVVAFGLKQAQITAVVVLAVAIPTWVFWRRTYLGHEKPRGADPARTGEPEMASG